MSSTTAVGMENQDSFGNYRLTVAQGQTLAATGNSVITLPILSGGIGGGAYIIRRITVANPANIAGGSVMNVANKWLDLALVAGASSTAYTADALFVKVGTAVANASVNISVFGDVVSF